jgi:methionyl aminopeptidase
VSAEGKQLCEVTKIALDEAIKICGPGVPYKKIGSTIHGIADKYRYGLFFKERI